MKTKAARRPANIFEIAGNLALFLTEKTGSPLGRFRGKLPAEKQRELFGLFLGKGTIVIDGENETLGHIIKVCFGLDWHETFNRKWHDIPELLTRSDRG
jgi:hypothetical protein